MSDAPLLAAVEAAYLRARDARDRLDVARATGEPPDAGPLEAGAAAAEAAVRVAMAELDATPGAEDARSAEDRRALAAMRAGIESALGEAGGLSVTPSIPAEACADGAAWAAAIETGGDVLHRRLEGCYGAVAGALRAEGEALTRPQVLARLATDPDPAARRRLFGALEPLWRTVDGDGGERSPYRALVRESASRWAEGQSPIEANARALGVTAAEIEAWAVGTLEAWREAVAAPAAARGEPPIQPWDWWWRAGEADRGLRASLPLDRLFALNREVHRGLGADPDELAIRLDVTPRPGRPPVPVAFTTFGARPYRRADGSWDPGRPTILASYTDGGLGELTELVHETGHAIHIGAIRTRPAFADWPDSDALTEALGELVSLDLAEPAFARRWLPEAPAVPEAVSLRCRYADVALDAAWALLEIRLHGDPERRPNDAWTEITSRYLGIAPHPEWSWWAIRGQLVGEPGYMANYAIGAALAADLRAAIRAARGDWIDGDPGWYAWVSERVYRFGLERSARDVLRDVLGRAPAAEALLRDIARARG
ncbi:MAG: hypothetical protein AB1627_00375 [Chloroflexota bacterium]